MNNDGDDGYNEGDDNEKLLMTMAMLLLLMMMMMVIMMMMMMMVTCKACAPLLLLKQDLMLSLSLVDFHQRLILKVVKKRLMVICFDQILIWTIYMTRPWPAFGRRA